VGEELKTKKDLQLEVPEENISTWKTVYIALNALKPTETILQVAAAPPPFLQKQEQTKVQSSEIFSPAYDEIPNPTQEMWGVDPPESDNPFDPKEIDTEDGSDLYPPLTLVKVMVAPAPRADEILQVQQEKSTSHMSLIKPLLLLLNCSFLLLHTPPFGSYGTIECCRTAERIVR